MFNVPLPSYSEHILLYGRNQYVLRETDLDTEFLESVCKSDYVNHDTLSHFQNAHHGMNHTEKVEDILHLNDEKMSDHVETNYDEITGETRVKLGAYSYPIDITSCFTNAENCLQQTNPETVGYVSEDSAMELLCHGFRESPPFETQFSNSYTDNEDSDWLSLVQTCCIDNTSQEIVEDNQPEPSFIQLVSRSQGNCPHSRNNSSMMTELNGIEEKQIHAEADSTTFDIQSKPASQRQYMQLNKSNLSSFAFSCTDQREAITPYMLAGSDNVHQNSVANDISPPSSCMNYETLKSLGTDMKVSSPKQKENSISSDLLNLNEILHSGTNEFAGKQKQITDKISRDRGNQLGNNQQRSKTKSSCIIESKESLRNFWNDCDGTTVNRRKKLKRGCKLWEFIRNLLLNHDYNPSWIKWEDRNEGTFKLVQSKAIAHKWGMKKGNVDMTYEKLSRAMRYYYKKQVFQPVLGKRLIYKFGPRATGWRDDEWN
ncbi:mammary gland involution [Mactra antiquata]